MKNYTKQWHLIYDVWEKSEVPDVKIIEFEIGLNLNHSPWFSLKENRQVFFHNFHLMDTAYHLCSTLRDKDPELVAAYKILAYLWFDKKNYFYDLLTITMQSYGIKQNDLWNSNAINILPPCKNINYLDFRQSEPVINYWEMIVINASNVWKTIANEWAIIQIPDLMDENTDKYKFYNDYCNKINYLRDYQEYIRLKNKFQHV